MQIEINKKVWYRHIRAIMLMLLVFCISCKDKEVDEGNTGEPYDPSKPVELTEFIPETGGMASQVIIKGKNFGTDASKLKVYFNKKQGKVIRTIGNLAYVLAPRLPGDTCTISVVIGEDSLQYEKPFYYETKVHVYTVAGTPEEKKTVDGTLVEARFDNPFYLAVDKEKNIFVGEWQARARIVNEERNSVVTLMNVSTAGEMMSGCTDAKGEVIYFPMNGMPYYYEFDPEQQWTPRRINPTIQPGDNIDLSGKYSFTVSEVDSMIYTITTRGELVKINPKTRVASLVMKDILKDRIQTKLQVYLAFHPFDKHILYFVNPSSMNPADGPIVGTDKIYTLNMITHQIDEFAGSGVKGHADGPKALAEFNNPCQICFDKDGNLYVGDTDNYCVRRISTDGIVSTIAGIPRTKGYLDGDPEIALFDRFWGMKIDEEGTLYIADYYNRAIRKLTIQ
ncbi:IPT/TIG domain-containing protein [Proteiniphilum sp.]|uniref:IPT/TIG domain-containing protein n=1 Tax=Proteiniphilum sp. TaxID=1926877 RepID=UPI002B1EEE2A|nr:IPT/TIG domain-containing protein [Proteiniphilum sp.]MEA4917830.1 IPT/TIG domain-containing protein [Proteiniphilum sp.]